MNNERDQSQLAELQNLLEYQMSINDELNVKIDEMERLREKDQAKHR